MLKPGQSWKDLKSEESAEGKFVPDDTIQRLGIKQNTAKPAQSLGPQPEDSPNAKVDSIKNKLNAIRKELLGEARTKDLSNEPLLLSEVKKDAFPLNTNNRSVAKDEKEAEKVANSDKTAQGEVEKAEGLCKKCGKSHGMKKCASSYRDMKKAEGIESEFSQSPLTGNSHNKMKKSEGYKRPSVNSMREQMASDQGFKPNAAGKVPAVKQDFATGVKTPKDAPQASAAVIASAAPKAPTAPKREFVQGQRFRKSVVELASDARDALAKIQKSDDPVRMKPAETHEANWKKAKELDLVQPHEKPTDYTFAALKSKVESKTKSPKLGK